MGVISWAGGGLDPGGENRGPAQLAFRTTTQTPPQHLYLCSGSRPCSLFPGLELPSFLGGRWGCRTQPGPKPGSRTHTLKSQQASGAWRGGGGTHLRLDPRWCEGNHPDGRQTQLAVVTPPALPLQEGLQALLQHLVGPSSTSTGGVDELRVQVEDSGGGSAGGLSTTCGPGASLEDPAQPGRRVLGGGDARSGKDNKDINAGFERFQGLTLEMVPGLLALGGLLSQVESKPTRFCTSGLMSALRPP